MRNVGFKSLLAGIRTTAKCSDTSVGARQQNRRTHRCKLLIPALDERARAAIATGRMREAVEVLKRLAKIGCADAERGDLPLGKRLISCSRCSVPAFAGAD